MVIGLPYDLLGGYSNLVGFFHSSVDAVPPPFLYFVFRLTKIFFRRSKGKKHYMTESKEHTASPWQSIQLHTSRVNIVIHGTFTHSLRDLLSSNSLQGQESCLLQYHIYVILTPQMLGLINNYSSPAKQIYTSLFQYTMREFQTGRISQ